MSIFRESDVLTLHSPLTPETKHVVNEESLKLMKNDAVIINTSRGGLIHTKALVHARMHTFPNVLITGHQAFLTTTALSNIADVSLNNLKDFVEGKELKNKV